MSRPPLHRQAPAHPATIGPVTEYGKPPSCARVVMSVAAPGAETLRDACPEMRWRATEVAARGPVPEEVDVCPSSRPEALTAAGVGWEE